MNLFNFQPEEHFMRSYARSVRIAELFQREIADILMRKVGDPRLEGVTITRVEVSNDLKLATVFFDVWATGGDVESVLQGFKSAHALIKKELARRVRLMFMPRLEFVFDQEIESGRLGSIDY